MKFQDDISNMNTYTRTHTHTDKPKPICPPLFQSWGHKDNIYFRTIEEREKINEFLFRSVFLLNIIGSSSLSFSMLISFLIVL